MANKINETPQHARCCTTPSLGESSGAHRPPVVRCHTKPPSCPLMYAGNEGEKHQNPAIVVV